MHTHTHSIIILTLIHAYARSCNCGWWHTWRAVAERLQHRSLIADNDATLFQYIITCLNTHRHTHTHTQGLFAYWVCVSVYVWVQPLIVVVIQYFHYFHFSQPLTAKWPPLYDSQLTSQTNGAASQTVGQSDSRTVGRNRRQRCSNKYWFKWHRRCLAITRTHTHTHAHAHTLACHYLLTVHFSLKYSCFVLIEIYDINKERITTMFACMHVRVSFSLMAILTL